MYLLSEFLQMILQVVKLSDTKDWCECQVILITFTIVSIADTRLRLPTEKLLISNAF